LKDLQNKIAVLAKDEKDLLQEVTTLQAKVKDVAVAVEAYTSANDALSKRMASAKGVLKEKVAMALTEIKDDQTRIDGVIADFDKKLGEQQEAADEAADAATKDKTEANSQLDTAKAALQAYADLKSYPAQLDASLKVVEGLTNKANQAFVSRDHVATYLFATDAATRLSKIVLKSAGEYQDALQKSQEESLQAQAAAELAASKAKGSAEKAASLTKAAAAANASRSADLLAALKPKPAAPAKKASSS